MSTSARPVRLFVASLGNPPPLHSTRHSAGHLLLNSLASNLSLPSPSKDNVYAKGAVSLGHPSYTLWQSPSFMNISGVALVKAWKYFTSHQSEEEMTGLVILHDELESPLGEIKVRRGHGSAKGHNGIKSVQESLVSAKLLGGLDERFIKVGIGIGRPASRQRDDVSRYVLEQVMGTEKAKIEGAAHSLDRVLAEEVLRLGK